MKFTTFIKAYKLALANMGDKVSSWQSVYLGSIHLPEDNDNKLTFVFSSGYNMQPGDMGISASLNITTLENVAKSNGGLNTIAKMTSDALDKDVLAREYKLHKEKINEAGRFVVLLEVILDKLYTMEPDKWSSTNIENVYFDFDKDLAEFDLVDTRIYTDGQLVLLG